MIHEPNTTVWKMGDLVLHDDDAKRPDMLMKVVSRIASGPRKGLFRTRYAYPQLQPKQWRRTIWVNPIEKLHDPARFGIDDCVRAAFQRGLIKPVELPPNSAAIQRRELRAQRPAVSPYREALYWIEQHRYSGSAARLAKLILSLWNSDACYSFRECIDSLDDTRTAIAVRCAAEYAKHGETQDLVDVGYKVHALFPGLWDIGVAGTDGKRQKREELA